MGILLNLIEDFSYYNAPEGQDPVGKVVGFGKIGFAAASYISVIDCCLFTKTQNLKQVLNTAGFWIVPMTGMCVSFASVAYIMNRIVGKDSHVNYFAGALSSGYIFHTWVKNPIISIGGTLMMVICAAVKKDGEHYGRQKTFEVGKQNKWQAPWRHRPDRQFLSEPRYKHDKESYWVGF